MTLLNRIIPKSLAGQMIALLLLAIVSGHIIAFIVFSDERREAVHQASRGLFLNRAASVIRLLDATPAELHQQIIASAGTQRLRFSLADKSLIDPEEPEGRERVLAGRLSDELGSLAEEVRVRVKEYPKFAFWRKWQHDNAGMQHRHRPRQLDLGIAIKITGGQWLNAETRTGFNRPVWAAQSMLTLLITALAIIAVVIFAVRRITRPLHNLAKAADNLGRGALKDDVAVEGPEDMQQAIIAFNQMKERLERYIEDRTNMLAAVSHDLKTPITSLRIRAEFIEDKDLQEKIIQALNEMQNITESTLNFIREESKKEDTRPTDINALLASLTADFQDIGHPVQYAETDRLVLHCRPTSLKRALGNIVENAVIYGDMAEITLSGNDETGVAIITVDDKGPGIPESELERVFQPFQRLETSRSRETGGNGLGLAIVRSIIRGHGGEIELSNRHEGGLRAIIHLPTDPGSTD